MKRWISGAGFDTYRLSGYEPDELPSGRALTPLSSEIRL